MEQVFIKTVLALINHMPSPFIIRRLFFKLEHTKDKDVGAI